MKRIYKFDVSSQKMVEITPERGPDVHYVQDDIKEFHSPDGARISGRRQWKEHLKRTGTVEMGHSDMRAQQANWQKRREAFAQKVSSGGKFVAPAEPPSGEIRPMERSRVSSEVANRLDGRPAPDRKTLIKIALEEARRHSR